MARRRLSERERQHRRERRKEQPTKLVRLERLFRPDPTRGVAQAELERMNEAMEILKEADSMDTNIQDMDLETLRRKFGAWQTFSDAAVNLQSVLHDAVQIVERQEEARAAAVRPFVYGLANRYYSSEPKRRFLWDNRQDYEPLVTLRHALRNAMKHDPRNYGRYVYAILLISGDDLALTLKMTPHHVREALRWLSQWGYVQKLRVVMDGNRRLGTAWLWGRMLHDGKHRPEPTWLEPSCVVPTCEEYQHDLWQGPCEWANGDDALRVPPELMYRPAAALAAPNADPPSAEALALAESIHGY